MGQQCGCGGNPNEEGELHTNQIPKNGVTLGRKHYSARDIYIIVRMQAYRRGVMARRRVQALRYELYSPGYNEGREDYENINV